MSVAACTWPASRLGEALYALLRESFPRQAVARRAGRAPAAVPDPPAGLADGDVPRDAWEHWVEAVAAGHGLELEPFEGGFGDLSEVVAGAGPAVLELDAGYLVLVGAGRRGIRLLAPGGSGRRVPEEPTRHDLLHGRVLYQRPPGSRTPDTDPQSYVINAQEVLGAPPRRLMEKLIHN